MVEARDAVSVTDCGELYVEFADDGDTVSGARIVYVLVTVGLVFPKLSFAKNLSVVDDVIVIGTGLVPLVLDVVGVVPSVV